MNNKEIGKTGEDMAARYLQKHGYKILERNFLTRHGEIDIIAQDGDYIVFVEVKRRFSTAFGLPREAVTASKQRTIVFCATYWLGKHRLTGKPARFDVVEILNDEITLIKDAFRP